jgi:hypothetical protein
MNPGIINRNDTKDAESIYADIIRWLVRNVNGSDLTYLFVFLTAPGLGLLLVL